MTTKARIALTCAVLVQMTGAWGAVQATERNGMGGRYMYTLPTVVVESTSLRDDVRFASQSMTVITEDDMARMQAKSVEDVIFNETGMIRNTDAMGRVLLSVRGAEPRHTLILVDGHPVMGDLAKYSGQADELMRLGTENVERIEIIRGAASARYGADAIGGVVNVITKSAAAKPKLLLNGEGRRVAEEDGVLPYKNYFLRADTGQIGKFRAAIYGSHRGVMPIYSSRLFYHAMNADGPIRNALRFFGDIQNIGVLATYRDGNKGTIDVSAHRTDEVMKRLTKHSMDGPDPVVHYGRNVLRDTYRVNYRGMHKGIDWNVDMGYAKMAEDDITISSVAAFSKYEGKNKLRYLDHVVHQNWNLNVGARIPMNDKHMLSFGAGYMKERGEGTRVKGARQIRTRHIDPWDYDKNLHTEEGVPNSGIEDYPMALSEQGIPQYDRNYDLYGYRDEKGRSHAPVYSFEDYEKEDDADEAKKQQFIAELRRDNPASAFVDEDGDPFDDDTILRRYYGTYKRTLTWHGKKFEEEKSDRKNRQRIGQAEIEKKYVFLQDQINIGANTELSSIVRWDHSNLFGSQMSANVGLVHSIGGDKNRRFKANIGTGYTEPGIGELYYHWEMYAGMPYDLGIGKLGHYWYGNPNLKPEKSLNFDIGYEQEIGRNRFRMHVFHNRIRDYMTTYFTGMLMNFHPEADAKKTTWITPPDMIYSFKNIGRAEITGVETEVSGAINHSLSWKLGYTYLHAINKSDPFMPHRLLNKPEHKIDVGLIYEYPKQGLQVSLWGNYYLHMLDSNTIANNGNYVHNDIGDGSPVYKLAENGTQTYENKSFGLWNLLIRKRLNGEATVYLGVDNLFNHRDDDQAIPERTYRAGVNLRFDGTAELFSPLSGILPKMTLDRQAPFIVTPIMEAKDDVHVFGDYRIRYNAYTGKNKPADARVTTNATVGSAYKNYLEKADQGWEQRIRFGVAAPLGSHTDVAVMGSLSHSREVDTSEDTGTMALNRFRLEQADVTHHMKPWDISVGRLTEPMGISGYWFGKEYDGIRAVWTHGNSQLRVGYGDFSKSTGIPDSAYSRAEKDVFMRAPTKSEWLGYDGTLVNDEDYTVPHKVVKGFTSLYDKLAKAHTLEEEKQVMTEYFRVMGKDDSKVVEKLKRPSSYQSNSHIWRVVTLTDRKGNKQQFLTTDIFDTSGIKGEDAFDTAALRKAGETSWETVAKRTGENKEELKSRYVSGSGLVRDQSYKFTSEFYGYGMYTGNETLADLGISWGGKRYAGFALEKLKSSDFQSISKEEAKEKAISSLYDKQNALEKVRKKRSDGTEVFGYRRANISPIAEKIIALAAGNSYWKPEDNSQLPLHLLAQEGYLFPQKGLVLKADSIPALNRAVYAQLRHRVTPTLGLSLWYLRSSSNDSGAWSGGSENMRQADVLGVGAKWQIGRYATLAVDYGVNSTKFGSYKNGHTQYEHKAGTSEFVVQGRASGDYPTFGVVRFDVGRADMNVAGSWNAFVDYKFFEHGSFFGGNGTESLPDRYLDGIRSFTVGVGYVPNRDFLLEGFYTFEAEGIGERDTLYGTEHFRLGNYSRVQATYRF